MVSRRPTTPGSAASRAARSVGRSSGKNPSGSGVRNSPRKTATTTPGTARRTTSRSSAPGRGPAGGKTRRPALARLRPRRPRIPVVRPVTTVAGVFVLLALLLTPYLKPWLAQRAEISRKKTEVAALEDQVEALRSERRRWDDPDYVKAQARQRLHLVMPGETGYVAVPRTPSRATVSTDPRRQAANDARAGANAGRPWYDTIWQSLRTASATTAPTPTPTSSTSSSEGTP
jgi:cell division protein FtsB